MLFVSQISFAVYMRQKNANAKQTMWCFSIFTLICFYKLLIFIHFLISNTNIVHNTYFLNINPLDQVLLRLADICCNYFCYYIAYCCCCCCSFDHLCNLPPTYHVLYECCSARLTQFPMLIKYAMTGRK